MSRVNRLLFAAVLVSPISMAAPADGEVTSAIHKTIDSFNTGDIKVMKSMFATGNISIVDEYAPHVWSGLKAFDQWIDAYGSNAKANAETDPVVTFNQPTRIQVDGKTAYAIMPTVYTWKARGVPMVEEAQMTFVLNQSPAGWKIRSMTWTGVTPHSAP